MARKNVTYSEPSEFFPKELRKKYKIGEYAPEAQKEKKSVKKTKK